MMCVRVCVYDRDQTLSLSLHMWSQHESKEKMRAAVCVLDLEQNKQQFC